MVLLPGAAHMSSTAWCGWTFNSSGGNMLTTSWRVRAPCSAFVWMYLCSDFKAGSLRSALRETSKLHAAGYHGIWLQAPRRLLER